MLVGFYKKLKTNKRDPNDDIKQTSEFTYSIDEIPQSQEALQESQKHVKTIRKESRRKTNRVETNKWTDIELKIIYCYFYFNFPYIFTKRAKSNQLSKYGLSQEQIDYIQKKVAPLCENQNAYCVCSKRNSDDELSHKTALLGKRSPVSHRDSETTISLEEEDLEKSNKLRKIGGDFYKNMTLCMDNEMKKRGRGQIRETKHLRNQTSKFFEIRNGDSSKKQDKVKFSNNQRECMLKFQDLIDLALRQPFEALRMNSYSCGEQTA